MRNADRSKDEGEGIDGEKMQAHLTAAGDQLLEQLHPRIDLLASRLMSESIF